MGIYEEYRDLAYRWKEGRTLKTDSHQESERGKVSIDVDKYVEIHKGTAEKAKSNGYDVALGSILDMPFKNGEFDTLIDTSTIDHVNDYEKALQEYSRVLKEDGKVMIAVWLTTGPTESSNELSVNKQVYFNDKEFKEMFENYFKLEEEGDFTIFGKIKKKTKVNYVHYFLGRKIQST
jgi:ubiquinone/menaquinone biosynthesis C-methylase UbiE